MSESSTAPRLHSQIELVRPPLDYPEHPYDEFLTRTAAHYPENTAVVFKDVSLTFRELEALTNSFANALLELGQVAVQLPQQSRVALGQHQRIRLRRQHNGEVVPGQPRLDRVETHHAARPSGARWRLQSMRIGALAPTMAAAAEQLRNISVNA